MFVASEPSGTPCCKCGGPVIEFSLPNEAWNTIIRDDGSETDQEYLCLTCFAEIAAEKLRRLTTEVKALREGISGALAHSYGPYSDRELLRRVVKILNTTNHEAADAAKGKDNGQ